MLGEQLDGVAVTLGIVLRQIFHGLNQQALALDVAVVSLARMRTARLTGNHRDHEYLGHFAQTAWNGSALTGRPVDEVYDSFYSASSFL
jgi:hypothetical protein